jgi:hypothetical protein
MNFNDIGANSAQEINAFKKIRMFSKTYTSNLVFVPNTFSSKYKNFSNLYINDTLFTDSYLYGLKRQHNFLSSTNLLNNQSTFLNLNSVNKFINFNFKNQTVVSDKSSNYTNSSFFKKNNNSDLNSFSLRLNNVFNNESMNNDLFYLNNSISYSNFISSINDDTDKAKLAQPIYKLFNKKLLKKNDFYNFSNINQLNSYNDLSIIDSNNEAGNHFFNNSISYKTTSVFSPNQSVSLGNRFVRNFVKNSSSTSNLNYSLNLNTINDYLDSSNKGFGFNNNFFFNSSNLD